MNLLDIFAQFPDQESCLEHLESIRWADNPRCPKCDAKNVARKADGCRLGRWNCHRCKISFNVLSGTIFEKTRIPLNKWFVTIGLMVNAKKSLSSYQLARDLDLTQPTALYMQQRIRAAMATCQESMLQGIVEADETYVGGKPRKRNKRDDGTSNPRGRGTKKTAVIGAVERGGKVSAKVASKTDGQTLVRFLKNTVEPAGTILMTDEYKSYKTARKYFNHAVINHSVSYADGDTHTNTIEGFWSLIKRAWYGSHHHYSKKWISLFVAESVWKYNHRANPNAFSTFIRECFA